MANRGIVDKLIQGFQQKDPKLYDILRLLSADITLLSDSVVAQINALVEAQAVVTTSPDLLPPENFSFLLPGDYLTLSWNTALNASVYEIRLGASWSTASLVTRTSSLSTQLNPITSGSHTYLIKSINSSGIYSSASTLLTFTVPSISSISITYTVIDNNVLLYWTEPVTKPFTISHYEIFRNGSSVGTRLGTFATIFETSAGVYTYGVQAFDLAGN